MHGDPGGIGSASVRWPVVEKACIRSARALVSVALDNFASGVGRDEVLASYPGLRADAIDAALACAAELACTGTMDLPLELFAGGR